MGERRDVATKAKEETGIKGFAVLLTKLDEGGYEQEVSDEMHELAKGSSITPPTSERPRERSSSP